MSVIINDFEIVVEPLPDHAPSETPHAPQPTAVPTPHDIEQIMRRREERAARLRAD